MNDDVLRDVYGPGLHAAILQSNSLMRLIVQRPRRRRFWYKPWTWRRKNIVGLPFKPEATTWTVKGPTVAGIPVVYDDLCPPGQAFLLDTENLYFGPDVPFEHWEGTDW